MLSDVLQSVLLSPWLALAIIPLGVIYLVYAHVTHPLSNVPAIHWSAPFSSAHILITKFFFGVRYTHYNAHLNKDGPDGLRPVLRVGPNEGSIMTTQGAETVFTGGYERAPWYDVFSNFGYVETYPILGQWQLIGFSREAPRELFLLRLTFHLEQKTCFRFHHETPIRKDVASSAPPILKPRSIGLESKTSSNRA